MAESPFGWLHVGHWTDEQAMTGCTVIRIFGDVVASGEVRGGAPATREFALLDPTRMVESVHAIVLSGGSAFGLAAADGVARSLRAQDIGFETTHGRVPIVVGMSLYDLGVGHAMRWPGVPEGDAALSVAARSFDVGMVGAGTGATVGKWRGAEAASPGGFQLAVAQKGDVTVVALVAVNAAGDVGGRADDARRKIADGSFEWPEVTSPFGENTTIGVVATNANLTKAHVRTMAEAAHDGLARAVFPAHGPSDGDAFVSVAKPEVDADLSTVRALTATAVEHAIRSVESSA